ncbi:MAG TPA: phosphoenolpyruvate synthase [Candidatus Paceibacterota bacterium]|nr:phosphoenolpyruvate synthase [Candidatus Pacearchaeota archaeon]HRZ50506.1 phosphoenolpyruvate synthase [Candidatus Paceibacterota bacterium]HSA36227.1 phosphoenolpyruvate synthase [Candidatus Paceibacterota bacterium]
MEQKQNIVWFDQVTKKDIPLVGGKNGSLGEMYSQLTPRGVKVPNGFIFTSDAYWYYLEHNGLIDKLEQVFSKLDHKNLNSLKSVSRKARDLVMGGKFPADLRTAILDSYAALSNAYGTKNVDVAVRSSATAEDLADASFAGQHETYLNVTGPAGVLAAVKKCVSSLFLERAIVYREEKGFNHMKVALSVGVMKMVRSDLASSGIMFTIDTETGFRNVVSISSIYGIGELIVKGRITSDQFYVFKPTLKEGKRPIIIRNLGRKDKKYVYGAGNGLKEVPVAKKDQLEYSITDDEVLQLANWAALIEEHYGAPQDIEWAKDGKTGELFIVQARPETIYSTNIGQIYEEYNIRSVEDPVITGISVGNKIGQGKARVILDVSRIREFKQGEILVTKMTDPDWTPIMRLAAAIITDEGSKTCHAAIISRELGIPCIVGSKNGTRSLKTGQEITVDCTQGLNGRVFSGKIDYEVKRYDLLKMPKLPVKIMLNVGTPDGAFKSSFLPNDGVGLARVEFIFADKVKVHPLALYHFDELKDPVLKKKIDEITVGYKDKKEFFVSKLAQGVAQIGAAFWPKPVIVRFSDFKTNEYRSLLGGEAYEPNESNPMIGWRGASRYYDPEFAPAFAMECSAIRKVREEFGLRNIWTMIPFCRTVEEGRKVLAVMKENGLMQGADDLKVMVMCEIPSNVVLADQFLDIFDGMSIGSNDLTQLTLGLDRDSSLIAKIGDERNEAVKSLIRAVIAKCKARGKYCGICGQAPSDYADFAQFIMDEGIESMSLNPDSVIKTIMKLAKLENNL